MIYIIKTPKVNDSNLYLLKHISKEKVYYKYYTLDKLLALPECKVNKYAFRYRLRSNEKYFLLHGEYKYKDLWDVITRPLARNSRDLYSFDVNYWPVVNHETAN